MSFAIWRIHQYTGVFQICSMEFLLSYTDRVLLLSVAVTATSLVSMFLWFYYVYLKRGSLKVWKPEESTAFFRVPLEEGTSDPNDIEMEEKLLKIEKPVLQCMVWSSQPLPTTFLHQICSSCPCMCTLLGNSNCEHYALEFGLPYHRS
jgi:hypothetical protein